MGNQMLKCSREHDGVAFLSKFLQSLHELPALANRPFHVGQQGLVELALLQTFLARLQSRLQLSDACDDFIERCALGALAARALEPILDLLHDFVAQLLPDRRALRNPFTAADARLLRESRAQHAARVGVERPDRVHQELQNACWLDRVPQRFQRKRQCL